MTAVDDDPAGQVIEELAAALEVDPSEVTDDTDLFEFGLESLALIRLVGRWRARGLLVDFEELADDPTPGAWRALLAAAATRAPSPPAAVADGPALVEDAPFDLAPLQHAYWVGRQDGQPYGGVAAHFYVELDGHGVDPDALRAALRGVVARHDMLRMRITPEGRQWTAPAAVADQADIEVHDLRTVGETEGATRLAGLREQLTHQRMDVDGGQVLSLHLSLLPGGATRVHLDLDMIAGDALSLRVLMADLASAYSDPDGWDPTPPASSFRSYLVARAAQSAADRAEARAWWHERISDLPEPPLLPMASTAGRPDTAPRTVRLHHWVDGATEASLTRRATAHGVTTAVALATIFAECVGRWSENPQFLLNLPLFARDAIVPDVDAVVGDFSSSVLLGVDTAGAPSFADRARAVRADLHAAIARGAHSGVDVLRDLTRLKGRTALAPVVYTSAVGMGEIYGPEVRANLGEPVWSVSQGPQVWLDAQVTEHDGGLLLNWDVRLDALEEGPIRDAFAAYRELVTTLANDDDTWLRSAAPPLPTSQDQRRASVDGAPRRRSMTLLHGGFLDRANSAPDAIAMIGADGAMSYGELDKLSEGWARQLVAEGLKPGDPVVVTLPKGFGQIIAALAVLRAGACYVPVTIDQPPARRARIHAITGAALALTDASHASIVATAGARPLVLEGSEPSPSATRSLPTPVPDDLAYVLFTSGSTGEPKGVEMSHGAAAHTVTVLNDVFTIGPVDRVLTVSGLEFDLSVYDIFGLLAAGGALVVVPERERTDPTAWLRSVVAHRVTVWNTVPALLDLLLQAAESTQDCSLPLRAVLLGGDRVSGDLPGRLRALAPASRFAALGGMTEAAIHSTLFEVGDEHAADPPAVSLPWGVPLDGVSCRVVDGEGRDCPDGVVGELWMGGVCLARGYRGDPARTAERFVVADGQRWYRTGDRARYGTGGYLEFAGRVDRQVKIHGHRIEPGEIEAAVVAAPNVSAALVTPIDTGAGTRLVAAVVTGAGSLDHDALHASLAERVPDHMRCAWFVELAELPLTSNGKTDRTAVVRMLQAEAERRAVGERGDPVASRPPEGWVEQTVADIWQDLLGVDAVIGRDDSFFALGGDSLLATRLLVRLQAAGIEGATLGRLFATPELAEMCQPMRRAAPGVARGDLVSAMITPAPDDRHRPFPLTDVQRTYLVGRHPDLPLGGVGTWQYTEYDGVDVDLGRMNRGWRRLVDRHEMLRAVIVDGAQRILPAGLDVAIVVDDVVGLDTDQVEAALARMRNRYSHRMVDLEQGPLLELAAVRYRHGGAIRTRLGVGYDYIVLDALSIMTILTELEALYVDPEASLPPIDLSFRDYVLGRQTDPAVADADQAYWAQRLEELPPPPELPLTRDISTVSGHRFVRRQRQLDPEVWERIQARARELGTTPSTVLLSAYGEVLAAWTGRDAVTITLTLFDRRPVHPHVERVVGDFTTLSLADYRRARSTSLTEAALALHGRLGADLDHREIAPSWLLRRLAQAQGALQPMPVVFTSAVGIGGVGVSMDRSPGFPQPVWGISQSPQVCLDNQVLPTNGGLQVTWDAADGVLRDGVLDAMYEAYFDLLARFAEDGWGSEPPVLVPPEQRAVRGRVSDTGPGAAPAALHDALLARAAEDPTAPALVVSGEAGETGTRRLSRGELLDEALRWTAALQAAGVAPGDVVVVTLPKGVDQLAATIGVVAAGAAYVPIGVDQPDLRRAAMHEAAGAGHVVAAADTDPLGAALITPQDASRQEPASRAVEVAPDDLAYVIFTSGSTGAPKGVEITHDAASNTCLDVAARFGIDPSDRVLALSALDFDLSVFDVFGVLGAGGVVVLPGEHERRDPTRWLDLVAAHGVTVWNTVPALLDLALLEAGTSRRAASLRVALLSGEWVGLDLPRRLQTATDGEGRDPARLVALGGATEAAIWSNWWEVDEVPSHWTSIPYGRPLTAQRYRVVDDAGRDTPDWVPGELWIGGRGVAKGYRNDPGRTAERFVEEAGERWYRTGDLGRYWPDGTLEFLGRTDHQVKVGGHRLELGEVERALERLPDLGRAVVVATGKRNSRTLHATVEPRTGANLDPEVLRSMLAEHLPAYAIPGRIAVVDRMPLTANGKVDRAALLASAGRDAEPHAPTGRPPSGPMEEAVAALWAEILDAAVTDREISFFGLGGDSMGVLRMATLLRDRYGADVAVRNILAAPSVEAVAALAVAGGATTEGYETGTL
ncbi:MAG: amino acid adenylation domain-containing protein [Acidimicrobiales bacterium]